MRLDGLLVAVMGGGVGLTNGVGGAVLPGVFTSESLEPSQQNMTDIL